MKFLPIPGHPDVELATTPVTQAEFEIVMGRNPSQFRGRHNPVERVTWYEAVEFCERQGWRLPTEEEWLAAAGDPPEDLDVHCVFGREEPAPVAIKKFTGAGWYDLWGNVWEWTSTESGSYRVFRGGSWISTAGNLRAANRNRKTPSFRYDGLGFRVARDVPIPEWAWVERDGEGAHGPVPTREAAIEDACGYGYDAVLVGTVKHGRGEDYMPSLDEFVEDINEAAYEGEFGWSDGDVFDAAEGAESRRSAPHGVVLRARSSGD